MRWLPLTDSDFFRNDHDHVNVSLAHFARLEPEALLLKDAGLPSLGIRLSTSESLHASSKLGTPAVRAAMQGVEDRGLDGPD
jgi:hypothetical protein